MSEVATLLPLANWIKIFELTATPTSDHTVSSGEILGVQITRKWVWSMANPVLTRIPTKKPPKNVVGAGNAFQIEHPNFTMTVLSADLGEIYRAEQRVHSETQIPVLMTGDFDAYDNFQVLLKMLD